MMTINDNQNEEDDDDDDKKVDDNNNQDDDYSKKMTKIWQTHTDWEKGNGVWQILPAVMAHKMVSECHKYPKIPLSSDAIQKSQLSNIQFWATLSTSVSLELVPLKIVFC